MKYRGFKVNYPYEDLAKIAEDNQVTWYTENYHPTEEEIELSRNRIIEKIEKKFGWYRWTNRFEPVYVLAMKLDMGVH